MAQNASFHHREPSEAIQSRTLDGPLDCFAALAMTWNRRTTPTAREP